MCVSQEFAPVAQRLEQKTHNLLVASSNLAGSTMLFHHRWNVNAQESIFLGVFRCGKFIAKRPWPVLASCIIDLIILRLIYKQGVVMRSKKGFTLIELGISMGIMGSLAVVGAQDEQFETTQVEARILGNEIFQYNAAVSRYIAANAGDGTVVGTRVGSDWLKGSSCSGGLASEDFLACDLIPDNRTLKYHSQPRTTISYSVDGDMSARTVWDTIVGESGKPDSMVMGTAALVASGNYISQYDDVASGYQSPTVYCPDLGTVSASISVICGANRNAIVSTANVTSTVEPWLRTDHANTMRHAIEFDPDGDLTTAADLQSVENRADQSWLRQMVGVARLYNGTGAGGQSLVLGGLTGNAIYSDAYLASNSLLNGAVVMDGNAAVMNDIYGKANAFIEGDVRSATGDLVADTGDILADSGQVRGAYVRSLGDVRADGNIRAGSNTYAQRYYDSNDTGYYVDADSTSRLGSVDADDVASRGEVKGTLFRDVNNTARYVNPSSRSVVDSITAAGDVRATRFYDQNNTYYFTDPSSTSRINSMDVRNRLTVRNHIYLTRSVSQNGWCSPNGLVARFSNGALASCASNRWKSASGGGSACTRNTTRRVYTGSTTDYGGRDSGNTTTRNYKYQICSHDQTKWVDTGATYSN